MRMDKMTNKFQLALSDAQSLAVGRDHQYIEPLHVLAAMLDQRDGTIRPLLTGAEVNLNQLRSKLDEALDRLPQVQGTAGDVQLSQETVRVLNVTDKLAQKRKDQFISSELFLLAVLETGGTTADILKSAGAVKGELEKQIEGLRGGDLCTATRGTCRRH